MLLQIQYSKQITKELGKISVYFLEDKIKVGDIIRFLFRKKGLFIKVVPWRIFTKITSLKKLRVSYKESKFSKLSDLNY